MTPDDMLDQKLEEWARAAAPGPSIADEVMRRLEEQAPAAEHAPQAPPANRRSSKARRILRWLAPLATAAGIALALSFWPSTSSNNKNHADPPAGNVGWADIVRQFQSARTARLDLEMYEKGQLTRVMRAYLQAPDKARTDEFGPDGRTPVEDSMLIKGGKYIDFFAPTRLYWVRPPGQPGPFENPATAYLSILGLPTTSRPAEIEGIELSLEARGSFVWKGQTYEQQAVIARREAQTMDIPLTLCLDPKTRQVRLLRIASGQGDQAVGTVTLDEPLPNDLFEIPAGFTDVTAGIWPTLDREVRAVAEPYYAARRSLPKYRSHIVKSTANRPPTSDKPSGLRFRELSQGDRWRMDEILLDEQHRKYQGNFSFEETWKLLDFPPHETLMTVNGIPAMIVYGWKEYGRKEAGLSPNTWWVSNTGDAPKELYGLHLPNLGWPEWMDQENHMPTGWTITQPRLKYELLPPDPARPKLLRVRGTRPLQWSETHEYWIDSEQGYLCVRNETRRWARREKGDQMHQSAEVWEVLEGARTRSGQWYPKVATHWWSDVNAEGELSRPPDNKRTCYWVEVDMDSPVDERLLEWPAEVPPLASRPASQH